jgi:hypothetical protein
MQPALLTHALASSVFQSLISTSHERLPSLQNLAEFFGTWGTRYMTDWGRLSPRNAKFSAILFGPCPTTRSLNVFKITSGTVTREEETSHPVAIGSGIGEFISILASIRSDGEHSLRTANLPMVAIERMIETDARNDIGGALQLATATSDGVGLFARCSPVVFGKPEAKITFLGIDYAALGQIGPVRLV